jgi:hypothetical protein
MRVQETEDIYDLVEKSRVEESAPEAFLPVNNFRKASLDERDRWLYPSAPSHVSRLRPDSRRMTADSDPGAACGFIPRASAEPLSQDFVRSKLLEILCCCFHSDRLHLSSVEAMVICPKNPKADANARL